MRTKDLFNTAVQRFKDAEIPDPETEVAVLLGHLLQMSRTEIFLAAEQQVSGSSLQTIEESLARRLNREPLAYIVGEREFWSLTFRTTPDVLIPRPETELLVEKVLEVAGRETGRPGHVLDLGTGSGAIAITLAHEIADLSVWAVDCSLKALRVAAENARRHKVDSRVHFMASDWCSALAFRRYFDLVVTNPPYVSAEMFSDSGGPGGLQPEVGLFEPRLALDGGKSGLECIDRIIAEVHGVLRPGGWLFMEIGADQEEYLLGLFGAEQEYHSVKVHKDYAGLPRVFQARRF